MVQLKAPTSYQGAKNRIAAKVADILIANGQSRYYDLCCGSGAISIQLINSGIKPEQITMLDQGPWGLVWQAVGDGSFDIDRFEGFIKKVPKDPHNIQPYVKAISKQPASISTIYYFLLLQATSFGSKPIWIKDNTWQNCSFRNYWQPTATSNRRYPVNPMMPMPITLLNRMRAICKHMRGVTGICDDIANLQIQKPATIYIDPPYRGRTSYGFNFDALEYAKNLGYRCYLSEGGKFSNTATLLAGVKERRKGGISGSKKRQANEEWLNIFW